MTPPLAEPLRKAPLPEAASILLPFAGEARPHTEVGRPISRAISRSARFSSRAAKIDSESRPFTESRSLRRCWRRLAPWFDLPFVFYGHSMGSLVAFELAHELSARGRSCARAVRGSTRSAHHPAPAPVSALPTPR